MKMVTTRTMFGLLLSTIFVQSTAEVMNVLFVGNSLTSVHNLPGMLDALTQSAGSTITTRSESSTAGGSELSQHAGIPGLDTIDIPTVAKIRSGPSTGGHWDFVSFQEQSMSWTYYFPESYGTYGFSRVDQNGHGYVQLYLDILTNETRVQGGIPIFYLTPDPEDYGGNCSNSGGGGGGEVGCIKPLTWEDQKFVDEGYSYAAGMTKSMCAPCGNAAVANVASFGQANVYQDDVHPTELTQYSNACVFYAALTNKSPVGLGRAGTSFTQNITLVQEHAWAAYIEYRNRRLPECNATRCVRFFDENGNLNAVPTYSPTLPKFTFPPTIRVLPAAKCEQTPDLNATGMATLYNSTILTDSILQSASAAELLTRVGTACPSNWKRCYSGSVNGWDAYEFHALCDFRGPTLAVVKTENRIFGGFAPVSWGDRDIGIEAEGAWLFRIAPGTAGSTSAFQFVDLESESMKVMHDEEDDCIYLGKQEDLHLTKDCKTSATTYAYDKYVDPPQNYNDTWLAGSVKFTANEVEVFYAPNLVQNISNALGCAGSCSKIGVNANGVECGCHKFCVLDRMGCCDDWDSLRCFGPLPTHAPTMSPSTPSNAVPTNAIPTKAPITSTPHRRPTSPQPTEYPTRLQHHDPTRAIFGPPTPSDPPTKPKKKKNRNTTGVPIFVFVLAPIGLVMIVSAAVLFWKGAAISQHYRMKKRKNAAKNYSYVQENDDEDILMDGME